MTATPTSSRPSKPPATRSSSTPSCATGPRKTRSRTKTSARPTRLQKAAYGPTEYQVRHILVKTEDQAKNIISRLNKGADFDKLAKEFSEDRGNKDRGGQLGWVVPRSFVPTFGNAFAGMKEGTVSKEPVRTQFGFHVVKLDAKRPAQLFPTFEAQKPALVNALTNQRVNQHFGELVKNAKVQ